MRTLVLVLIGLFGVVAGSPALGQGGRPDPHSRVRLVAEQDAVVPGTSALIGLHFEIDRGWHVYQRSQNDTGLEPMVEWSASVDGGGEAGLGFGALQWPAGHRFVQPGEILDHGYEGSVLLMVSVDVPATLEVGSGVRISGSVEWLACDAAQCVPGSAEVSIELPVRDDAARSGDAGLFDGARGSMGRLVTGGRGEDVSVSWDGTTMVVTTDHRARLTFVPGPGSVRVVDLLGSGVSESGELRLRFEGAGDGPDGGGEVVGWVRLQSLGGQTLANESDVWLVRTRVGESPRIRLRGGAGGGG